MITKYLFFTGLFLITMGISAQNNDQGQNIPDSYAQELAEAKLVEKKVEKAEKKAKKEEKEEKEAKKEQKLKKEYDSKRKSIEKDEKQLAKLRSKLEKGKVKGTLSPVDIDKINEKSKKIEYTILKNKEKLDRLKRKL